MEKNFKLYDYKNKTVKQSEQTAETDFYGAFGWEPADISPAMPGSVTITFRRDRKAERFACEQGTAIFSALDHVRHESSVACLLPCSLLFSALRFDVGKRAFRHLFRKAHGIERFVQLVLQIAHANTSCNVFRPRDIHE